MIIGDQKKLKSMRFFQRLHSEMFAKSLVPIHNVGSYPLSYSRAYGILKTVVCNFLVDLTKLNLDAKI